MSVWLHKVSETEESVVYRYGPTPDRMGVLELDRETGDVYVREPVPEEQAEEFSLLGSLALSRCWREGNFPERVDAEQGFDL